MSFIPEEELKGGKGINLAPMIDFLFLMLMFFACLAVSRVATRDTEIELVEMKTDNQTAIATNENELKIINISINSQGEYKWVTEIRDYPMESPDAIVSELHTQYQKGLLPKDKELTQVFLKIDKAAKWEPILRLLFAIRDEGYDARPVYDPEVTG